MKTVKGTVLCCMSISLAIVALGCGNAIEGAASGWTMLGVPCSGDAFCSSYFGRNWRKRRKRAHGTREPENQANPASHKRVEGC